MSPIQSVATPFPLSPATPSAALDPNSTVQSASGMSHHLFGTGGLVFAVIAIVSVAGYLYHGRRTAKDARTSNTWASLCRFLSSIRPHGSAPISTEAPRNWSVDLEVGPQHVSMVYARFFRPTFWNLVECHPGTECTPAIYVEDEASEVPVFEPTPFGMNSFLDMDDDDDDDDDDDGDGDDNTKRARENEDTDQGARTRVKEVPPYDTSLSMNLDFSSQIIGTTVRRGPFLFVTGEEGHSSQTSSEDDSSSDSEEDFSSPDDGISRTPPGSSDDASQSSSSDSKFDLNCSPCDWISTISPGPSGFELDFLKSWDGPDSSLVSSNSNSDSELDLACSPYDGIIAMPPRFSSSTRRYGMPDMTDLAETLRDVIPEACYNFIPTVSPPTGLCDRSESLDDMDSTIRYGHQDQLETVDGKAGCVENSSRDSDTFAGHQGGLGLMRELLELLRDPNTDCIPRALSSDSDWEYSDNDEDKRSVLQVMLRWSIDGMMGISPESSPSSDGSNSDVSHKDSICPVTPLPRFTGPTVTRLVSHCQYSVLE